MSLEGRLPTNFSSGVLLGENSKDSVELWKTAYRRFEAEITDVKDHGIVLTVRTLKSLQSSIQKLPIFEPGHQSPKVSLPRIEQLLAQMKPFVDFLDDFHFEISPSTLICGSLFVMFSYGGRSMQVMNELLVLLDENVDVFSRVPIPAKIWVTSEALRLVFWNLYTELACLFARTIAALRQNRPVLCAQEVMSSLLKDHQQTSKLIRKLLKRSDSMLTLLKDSLPPTLNMETSLIPHKSTLEQRHCYHIPPGPNKRFVGRDDELKSVTLALTHTESRHVSTHQSVRSFALHGLGGVGKTQIALEYAYREKKAGTFDSIFWVTADNMIHMREDYSMIAQKLGLLSEHAPGNDAHTVKNDAMKSVNNWLATTTRKWLLIFDNADDLKLARQAWPNADRGSILLTSRDPTVRHDPALTALKIKPFDTDAGARAFLALTNRSVNCSSDDSYARKITDLLGGLPLALEQMSCFVTVNGLPLAGFLELYKTKKEDLNKRGSEFSTYPHTLDTVFNMTRENLSSKAADLQNLLAFFHPDAIDNSLIPGAARVLQSMTDLKQYAWLADDLDLIDTKRTLLRASLIYWDYDSTLFSLHRVVQDVTMTRMLAYERNTFFSLAIALLHASFPDFENKPGHSFQKWPQCRLSLPHIIRLAELTESKEFSLKPSNLKEFVNLLTSCSWFLYEAEYFNQVRLLMKVVSSIVDKNSFQFARACNYLGLIYNETNRPRQALEQFHMALEIHNNLPNPNGIRILSLLNNIGMSHTELRQYNEALDYHAKAQKYCEAYPDFRDMSYRNTASVYLRKGELEEAEQWLKRCPTFQQSTDETDMMEKSARFADDVMFLSMIRMQQCKLDAALKLCSKVLDFRKAKVGNTLRTCSTLYLRACILFKQRNLDSARNNLNELIEICRTISDSDGHRIRAQAKLADIYDDLGDQNQSVFIRSEAIEGRKGVVMELKLPQSADFQDLVAWMAV